MTEKILLGHPHSEILQEHKNEIEKTSESFED